MSDSEAMYDSDQDVSQSHSKLIEAVQQLDKGQRIRRPERSEPTLEVSEFHLVKSGISDKDPVRLYELAKTLKSKGHHTEIVKKLRSSQKKSKVLPKPLEKPAAERIKRVVGFENTRKELGKWNAIITKNRVADTISFPLTQSSMKPETSNEFLKRPTILSELQKELAALDPPKEINEEKEDKYSMTLEEIIERRKEAARFRAQQSYKEAKAHRQRKIKSKKFHRVQRKERIKQQLKEFEELQKTNPEAALEKLEELDRTRAEERMSLRHKSTGQWAKNKQVRAKYDKETRQVLAQQLSIGRELTQKVQKQDDSEEENDENIPSTVSSSNSENPWVQRIKTDAEIDEFINNYRKYWDEKNKKEQSEPSKQAQSFNIVSTEKVHTEAEEEEVQNDTLNEGEEADIEIEDVSSNAESDAQSSEDEKTATEIVVDSRKIKNKSKKKGLTCNGSVYKISATSKWNVESINGSDDSPAEPTHLKVKDLNDIFDPMEDTIESHVKSKLKKVKEKLNVDNKRKRIATGNKNDLEDNQFEGLEFKNKKHKPVLDEPMDETVDTQGLHQNRDAADLMRLSNGVRSDSKETDVKLKGTKEAEIDPNKYINVKPVHLKTQLPDVVTGGDEGLDDSEDEKEKHNIISEAFADDDVVDEFRKEKEDQVKKSQPEDLDLSMPGWGSWGGKCVPQSKRKKRRFILKFPKDAPRRDENKGDVIIIEEKDQKIRQHQVSDLPFPFSSVKDFEASIRAPIGRNFVPENVHKKLIEPSVKTKLGKIIEPMSEEVLVDAKKFQAKKGSLGKRRKVSKAKVGK